MKAILTSTGFDNKNIQILFIEMLNKPVSEVRALFVPAALTTEQQEEYGQCFLDDLLGTGIDEKNIVTYNLESPFEGEIAAYDVIYFSGGDPELLMSKINAMGFKPLIDKFVDAGGIYFGASAGSDIAANGIENGLNYVGVKITCHDKQGHPAGEVDTKKRPEIKISDTQAVIVDDGRVFVVE